MLIFAAVSILYVGPEGDIFVFPTIFFLEHVPRQFNLYFMLQWNLNIAKLYIMLDWWEQRPLSTCLCNWLKNHISLTVKLHSCITVEPQYNEGPRDFQNLFTIIFHIFYYYRANENHSLYWGLYNYRGYTVFTPRAGLSLKLHVGGYVQLVAMELNS